MKFEFEHLIPADPHRVAEVTLDTSYQESLEAVVRDYLTERKVLFQEARGNATVHRKIRCVLGIDLPRPAQKLIGSKEPAWVEDAIYHPRDLRWEWDVKPEIGGALMKATGTVSFEDQDGATLRRVTGEVKFNVPVYGGRVEGLVVDHLERIYASEAKALVDWLSDEPSN